MKRPLSVTIIACIYIAAGAIGIVYHLSEVRAEFSADLLIVSLVRIAAIVAGLFMLRGCDWARWLALAWMAFHVAVSAFDSLPELAMHAILLAVFAYFLIRARAARYFRPRPLTL